MLEFIGESKSVETKHLIQKHFLENNDIVEEEQYYIMNGKHKIKKVKFFETYFNDEEAIRQIKDSMQGGYLYITNDRDWISRCSDKLGGWTSWTSCFRPGGEHNYTRELYADSDNIWMAMILNKSKSKIIGRRFVIVPEMRQKALFLKHYGNWADQFNIMLFDWVANNLLADKKYNIAEATNAYRYDRVIYNYDKQCYSDIWIDALLYAIYNDNCSLSYDDVNLGRHQVLYNDHGVIKSTFIASGSTELYHKNINVLDFNTDNIDEIALNVLSGNVEYPKTSVANSEHWIGSDSILLIHIDGNYYLVVYDDLRHNESFVKKFHEKLIELNTNNKKITLCRA